MDPTMLICALVVITTLSSLLWILKTRRLFKLGSLIPPPEGTISLPIIGHGHYFLSDTDTNFDRMFKFIDGPEPVYHFRFFYFLYVCTIRPEDYEIILNSPACLGKGDIYHQVFKPVVGNGMFTCNVPTFKRHRKIILPTFNQKVLDRHVEVFVDKTNTLIGLLEKESGIMFNIFHLVEQCNIDVVMETLAGIPINHQVTKDGFTELSIVLKALMQRTFNVLYYYNSVYKYTKLARDTKPYFKTGMDLVKKAVADKIAAYQSTKDDLIMDDDKKGFLDTLIGLADKGQFTYSESSDEYQNFIVAGADTTTITNCFLMIMLALHPEIEQKVYDEVMDILGPDRDVDYTDINKFHYLDKVIKETMRLFPAGPMIVRKASEDVQLETCVIPKGAQIILRFCTTQRRAEYYPDPLKFDPERFSPEEVAKRHPYAFLSYSGGMRNCIGHGYATILMKVQTAMLIRKFRFETAYKSVGEIEVRQNIVLQPLKGFPVKLIPRN